MLLLLQSFQDRTVALTHFAGRESRISKIDITRKSMARNLSLCSSRMLCYISYAYPGEDLTHNMPSCYGVCARTQCEYSVLSFKARIAI